MDGITIKNRLAALLLLLLFSLHNPLTQAEGTGWRVRLFDYQLFVSSYNSAAKTPKKLLKKQSKTQTDQVPVHSDSDAPVYLYLRKHWRHLGFISPELYDRETISADAIRVIVAAMVQRYSGTPARHLLSGRRYRVTNGLQSCQKAIKSAVRAECERYVMLTPAEAETVFWQLTAYQQSGPVLPKKFMLQELARLRDVFKEATLKRKGVYFYARK